MKNVVHINKGVVRASVKEEKRKAKSEKQKAKNQERSFIWNRNIKNGREGYRGLKDERNEAHRRE